MAIKLMIAAVEVAIKPTQPMSILDVAAMAAYTAIRYTTTDKMAMITRTI